MKKIVTAKGIVLSEQEANTPYPEATPKPLVKWEEEAIESLQSLERYTILKAIDEGKRLVKRVMDIAAKGAGENETVMKFHVQNAIAAAIEELEKSRRQTTSEKPS